MRNAARFKVDDKVWAGNHELALYFAGRWWPTPLRGVVSETRYCDGAEEWYYLVVMDDVRISCVFPESNIILISVLERVAEAGED